MRTICFCSLTLVTLALAGCTEMRIEGDAKVFQSSAIGTTIRTIIGLGLIGLGVAAVVGSISPDRKAKNRKQKNGKSRSRNPKNRSPKNRTAKVKDGLPSRQRVGLALFGGAMGFAGLFLVGISFIFPGKLHVTVYPDRVAMASTYSQTGGNEIVVPFSRLSSVELRDERNLVGKLRKFLVFTQKNGKVIRQNAGNNERKAVDTIRQALANFQTTPPADVDETTALADSIPATKNRDSPRRRDSLTAATPQPEVSKATTSAQDYSLKRYKITVPVPAGYGIVGSETIVKVGAKLKACYAGDWSTVTVVGINDDGTITCNWDSYTSYTYRMMREDLTIKQQNAAETPLVAPSSQYSLKRYEINIPVADGYAVVDAASEVKVGMKLGACYAGRWESVTVVAVNSDGTITCNWDKWTSFTYKMMREDLTISVRDAP